MILSEQKVKIVGMVVLASSAVAGPARSVIGNVGVVKGTLKRCIFVKNCYRGADDSQYRH